MRPDAVLFGCGGLDILAKSGVIYFCGHQDKELESDTIT